jgi:uncharacterized protein (DUF302 family)
MSTIPTPPGSQTLASAHTFPDTVSRLTAALQSHNVKIFAVIDQQAEAAAVGLPMRPLTLILFGNPKAGTPLMIASPAAGLDLPLKALVWADEANSVFVTFNTADYIITRHNLPPALTGNVAPIEKLIASVLQ